MYIYFDEYPTYSGAIYEFFETLVMPIFGVVMDTLIQQSKATC